MLQLKMTLEMQSKRFASLRTISLALIVKLKMLSSRIIRLPSLCNNDFKTSLIISNQNSYKQNKNDFECC